MIITNELQPLSKDLTTITTEIKSYENMAGQSIFEIGRRLNWVKEHDLTHGEFGNWLETIRLNQRQAQRFMKVANELPNTTTLSHLGTNVLYEIATLPEEDRDHKFTTRSGETKKPEDMTVRELRDLKKQLKAKEEALSNSQQENESLQAENDSMRKQQVQLNQQLAAKQEPKVVEKTVTKEVKPNDYDDIKRHITELEKDKKELAKKVDDQQAEINSYKDLQSQDRQAFQRVMDGEETVRHAYDNLPSQKAKQAEKKRVQEKKTKATPVKQGSKKTDLHPKQWEPIETHDEYEKSQAELNRNYSTLKTPTEFLNLRTEGKQDAFMAAINIKDLFPDTASIIEDYHDGIADAWDVIEKSFPDLADYLKTNFNYLYDVMNHK